jgi:predicted esterase
MNLKSQIVNGTGFLALLFCFFGVVLAQDDVADISSEKLFAAGDRNKTYFIIGASNEKPVPEEGFGLVIIMPGGDGSADFNPFVRRIYRYSLPQTYLVAQPVAVKWTPQQQIGWPTKKNKVPEQKFSTEEFVEAVIKDVRTKYKLNDKHIFTLSWSSSGPAAYAISLQEKKSVTGSFIAMSVFRPDWFPPLKNAASHAYFLYHSPDDKVCPFWMAQRAENVLEQNGAETKLVTYEGGHGWHGNIYDNITGGIEWLENVVSLKETKEQESKEQTIADANRITQAGKSFLYDDFETGDDAPDGWQEGDQVEGVQYIWNRAVGYNSKSSLSLRKTANNFFPVAQWYKTVQHNTSNKQVKVTVQVRAMKASKATVDVQFLDENGRLIENKWAAFIGAEEQGDKPVTHNWKQYSGSVDIPDGTKQITFALQIYGPGAVWFDDLKAEYIN